MSRVRLAVVEPSEVLVGGGPPAFERLARLATPDSDEHRGVVMIAATLAARSVSTCVPPTAQAELHAHLASAFAWIRREGSAKDVLTARATCFGAVSAIEELTKKAVRSAQAHLKQEATCPLDPHADHVVERYAGLGAHFTVSAVCHALDSVKEPASAISVLEDVEGARSYQAAGLGAARHAAFRNAAWGQATWEAERTRGAGAELKMSLGVQIFHEYLGGRWRAHADSERLKNSEFLLWALSGRRSALH